MSTPSQIKAFNKGELFRNRTDKSNATMLSRFHVTFEMLLSLNAHEYDWSSKYKKAYMLLIFFVVKLYEYITKTYVLN